MSGPWCSPSANEFQTANSDALCLSPHAECGGKGLKNAAAVQMGGAGSLPGLISAFPWVVFPCGVPLKDQMSSSTNHLLRGSSGNCPCVRATHCSCSKPSTRCSFPCNCKAPWPPLCAAGRTGCSGTCGKHE